MIEQKMNSYAKISLVLGIVTIVTMIFGTVYVPFISGGVAIIFAVLSRGARTSFSTTALAGLITSLAGILLNIALVVSVLFLYLNNASIREETNDYLDRKSVV